MEKSEENKKNKTAPIGKPTRINYGKSTNIKNFMQIKN